MKKYEKEFRAAHPETIGETDREFDNSNYTEWLEIERENLLNLQNVNASLSSKLNKAIEGLKRVLEFNRYDKVEYGKPQILAKDYLNVVDS